MAEGGIIGRISAFLEKSIEDEEAGFAYASYGADVCIKDPEKLARALIAIMADPQTIETAPDDRRVLVHFMGAGWIVAYRDPKFPEMWVRYLGYGKSTLWPTIHGDFATHWMELPDDPTTVERD